MSRIYLALTFLLTIGFTASPVQAGGKYALVVGNSSYEFAGRLPNAVNDAELIAAKLQEVGFEVDKVLDATEDRLGEALDALDAKASSAEVVALYFAGHGLQKDGVNFLVPIDAHLETEVAIERETLRLQSFLDVMEKAPVGLVFLDACRNNPFADALLRAGTSSGRAATVGRGLAVVRPQGDLLVTFATLPNTVASDGKARNSPFASSLAQHMTVPDVEISVLMKRVTRDVVEETQGAQRPQQLSQMQREFYFARTRGEGPVEREEMRTVLAIYPGEVEIGQEVSVLAEVPESCQPEFINISPSRKVTPIPSKFFARSKLGAGRVHYEISPGSRYGLVVQESDEAGRHLIGFFCNNGNLSEREQKQNFFRALDEKLRAGDISGSISVEELASVSYRFGGYSIR